MRRKLFGIRRLRTPPTSSDIGTPTIPINRTSILLQKRQTDSARSCTLAKHALEVLSASTASEQTLRQLETHWQRGRNCFIQLLLKFLVLFAVFCMSSTTARIEFGIRYASIDT
jgi:hypothetical protein